MEDLYPIAIILKFVMISVVIYLHGPSKNLLHTMNAKLRKISVTSLLILNYWIFQLVHPESSSWRF
jgi:hypothetical protein